MNRAPLDGYGQPEALPDGIQYSVGDWQRLPFEPRPQVGNWDRIVGPGMRQTVMVPRVECLQSEQKLPGVSANARSLRHGSRCIVTNG